MTINVPEGYERLGEVLQAAIDQAAAGKGAERHGGWGEPFHEQQICEIERRMHGGFCHGQAVKKIYESNVIDMPFAEAELLGAINYIAASVIVMREEEERDD